MLFAPALSGLSPATAQGEHSPEEPRLVQEVPGHWMLYGVTLGALLEDGTSYAALGLEVSYTLVRPSLLAYGGFLELRYDQGARGVALALGPEIGFGLLVIDAGPYARFGRRSALGVRARACLAVVGVISLCGGAAALSGDERFAEISLLLKYPRRRAREAPSSSTSWGTTASTEAPRARVSHGDHLAGPDPLR